MSRGRGCLEKGVVALVEPICVWLALAVNLRRELVQPQQSGKALRRRGRAHIHQEGRGEVDCSEPGRGLGCSK